ncbi:mycothiol-dependent nitroreductase Rv2466c family protein [Streptomyces tendae]
MSTTQHPVTTTPTVVLCVDPSCPWTWVVTRWLLEVERQRPIDLRFKLMSLSVLNEGRNDLTEELRERYEQRWRPVRVAGALMRQRGETALREFCTVFGRRLHDEGAEGDVDAVLAAVLDELGAPADLLAAADGGDVDEVVRASHAEAVTPIGPGVGTPLLHIGGRAFFGPVLTSIPRGQKALRLFDAVVSLAECPDFTELKTRREGRPSFG